MADNLSITQGTGTTIAADDIGGVLYQRIKATHGADGSATDVSSASPMPVTLANTGANATPVVVDLGANNDVTITGTVAVTQSGTWDEVGINDSGNSITVDNPTLSVVGGGAEATALRVTLASDSTGVLSVDDNGGSITVDGTVAVSGTPQVQGTVASDGVDADNPVKIGGQARSSEITAVANADRVNAVFDLVGKQIVLPYANPENQLNGLITTAMTGTTSTAVTGMGAQGAGIRNYITTLVISNSHATVGTDVILQDGNGGTTLGTFPAAALYGGVALNLPVPIKTSANTALYAANVTTGASTKVTCYGYKGV